MTAKNIVSKSDHFNYTVALAGNPNVGKSSIFNNLTGLNQHTGNWAGKTVEICEGQFEHNNSIYRIIDLPGTYSLFHNSYEEQITDDFILSENYNCIVIVTDSTSLERNLLLTIQILSKTSKAVLCLNMNDDAQKKGIEIDTDELSLELGIPVIKTSSHDKSALRHLKETIHSTIEGKTKTFTQKRFERISEIISPEESVLEISALSKEINERVSRRIGIAYSEKDKKLDYLFTSKLTGIPIMLLIFGIIFWITAVGANYPSKWFSSVLFIIKDHLQFCLENIRLPAVLVSLLLDGIYTTVSWVLSVMLPPAMIFFPLFAILEDFGYLPRAVFVLDNVFRKAGSTGKQALTMALGFGCNACGVTGCRIMSTKKEKLLASITNAFIPCNGRLPTLIALISIFLSYHFRGAVSSLLTALTLLGILTFCVLITLIVTSLASKLIKDGEKPSLILEMPPIRKPQIIRCVISSLKDKVLYVVSRALLVSAPCGALIWFLSNITLSGMPILNHMTNSLSSIANIFGIDGVILTALILSFPANELFIPIMLMSYLSKGILTDYGELSELALVLSNNGWTVITAICVMTLCIFHYPCSTTCFVIKKETRSTKVLIASIIIPTVVGLLLSFIINNTALIFSRF